MFIKILKNCVPVISLFLCIVFIFFICIINFPFLHNMEADVNIWNIKTYVILEGKHHHEDNPKSPCFDFHKIKIKNIGECLICLIFSYLRFIASSKNSNFFNKISYPLIYLHSSLTYISNFFNIPLFRAPPGIILLNS